ncbi:hypothetical protein [Lentiprolixibacter aurantiacus]|uniref:Uncharacterized protein n=1 Tax=Lentiprolixibacter aurantiacus TaxID=2993939 RepID=A0AAE3MI79_9FLAO|nr:hypothetical protein [Lentiprolixibacter aurantiacus]MCX2717986.1 hypothetical protein [Lentiprolixibacter aurantiacus]
MNKLLLVCGLVMLSTTTTPQEQNATAECTYQEVALGVNAEVNVIEVHTSEAATFITAPKLISKNLTNSTAELDLNEIVFIEEEEIIDLGFDTRDYLPEGFNANEVYVNLDNIIYIEEDESDLGFDTSVYLPDNFNAYAAPEGIEGINYMEEEEVIDLGFDTAAYLPEGFNPYETYVFNLDSVEYIEEDEEIEFDFNPADFLPEGFDPYAI